MSSSIPRRNMDQQKSPLPCCRHKTLLLLSLLCASSFVKAFTISTIPPTTLPHQQRNSLLTSAHPPLRSSNSNDSSSTSDSSTSTTTIQDGNASSSSTTDPPAAVLTRQAPRIRQRVGELAKRIVLAPIRRTASNISPMPKAVATVLKDATLNTLDLAVDEVVAFRNNRGSGSTVSSSSSSLFTSSSSKEECLALIEEAFLPVEELLLDQQRKTDDDDDLRVAVEEAKQQCMVAMEAVEAASIAQVEGAVEAVKVAEQVASEHVMAAVAEVVGEDVDFGTSEMAPPFLDENSCLVPGEPVVRVEKALENSRRIFAGIDIPHSVDDVWKLLTDYRNLQKAVPNLVVNDVLELYDGEGNMVDAASSLDNDDTLAENELCSTLANQMKGAKLRQVGGAKVVGIQFSARTTLEVREWPHGLPDVSHFREAELWEGKSRRERASEYERTKLERYRFPRPFAISQLPTKDITMQSVEDDDGEFRLYQGVWRMQPLPGCAPEGRNAMRLTYAVEVSPRAYLPVQLVEGRIVRDLCTNLLAIRDYLEKQS